MKKTLLISLVLACMVFLCACTPSESPASVYNYNKQCYYKASCQIDKPMLENFDFFMPMISDKKCNSISDLRFYSNNQDLNIDVSELNLFEIYSDKNKGGQDFRYNIKAVLNKDNFINSLHINKITAKIDNNLYEFAVDITIEYHYIQNDYLPINCTAYDDEMKKNSLVIVYLLTTNMNMAGGKITDISYGAMDAENVLSCSIKNNDDGSKYEIGDELKGQANYLIEIEYPLDFDFYVADNIYFSINYGSMTLDYSTNVNRTSSHLYNAFLEISNAFIIGAN